MKQTKTSPRNRRRGVAIEMAISMLVVVFALCSLLVTLAASSRTDNNRQNGAFTASVAVDQIGENFLAALANDAETPLVAGTFPCDDERYAAQVSVNEDNTVYTLRVYTKAEGTQKLEVSATPTLTGCRVLSWNH